MTEEQPTVSVLEEVPMEEMAEWMLWGAEVAATSADDNRNNAERFVEMYNKAGASVQEKMKKAMVKAVSDWDPKEHGRGVLFNLALLTVGIRNEDSLTLIIDSIDSKRIEDDDDDPYGCYQRIIEDVAMFTSNDKSYSALKRWYKDESFWKSKTTICLGILANNVKEFETIFPELISSIDKHIESYDPITLANVGVGVSLHTGPDKLEESLSQFDSIAAKSMLAGFKVIRNAAEHPEKYLKK